ncbi:FAD-binding protein [Clostridium tarantellae]|uniref:FAD-binding protein n=1 Tax=Clostridium tarantellae TaxID=39493 RepID=A0A6I1MKN2_9CLOT|nr:FAD-binding protein [Clostridium tarantellae]MPQ43580.1 FAD-binding protein [Clostridium tarantellae]
MEINKVFKDIVIIGSGLAGLTACSELQNNNIDIGIITTGDTCHGASFHPNTWGLGMVYAENEEDKKDFIKTIGDVGGNINNESLTKILINNAEKEILNLSNLGVNLKNSLNNELVIPCYDYKGRVWKGFDFTSAKNIFNNLFSKKNVQLFNHCTVLDIFNFNDSSKGLLMIDKDENFTFIRCKALIIASGGYTSLYSNSFSLEKNTPIIHYFAEKLGCKMINLEFIQFIPTSYCNKYKAVFNERAYQYITLLNKYGSDVIPLKDKHYLKKRSTYAPFTSRMDCKNIDFHIFKENVKSDEKVYFYYPDNIETINDTLIYNYFKWLKDMYGDINEKIYLVHSAHACNGGIEINEKSESSVSGIFACGEATGGIHGSDRIGGLSTVGAMVFGRIAAKNAKEHIKNKKIDNTIDIFPYIDDFFKDVLKIDELKAKEAINYVRSSLYDNTAIIRNKESLENLKINYSKLMSNLYYNSNFTFNENFNKKYIITKIQAKSFLKFGQTLLQSMINRENSLGSHYIEN